MERKASENEKVYHQVIEHITNLAATKEISFGSKIPIRKRTDGNAGI